ncbi:Fanconi anemia group B protein [Aulostomus maculatus]
MERLGSKLSFSGNLNLFNASSSRNDERIELTFRSFSFKPQRNKFLQAADGAAVISRRRAARVEVEKCQCAVHARERSDVACVLVSNKDEKGFHYSLLTLDSSNRLEHCFEWNLPYHLGGNVSILQGPSVLWGHAGSVFFTSLQAAEVRQVPFQLSHCIIGELPLCKRQVFVIGLQSMSEQNSNNNTLGYFIGNGQTFDGALILPRPYISITKHILVLSAEYVEGELTSAVVAVTSSQQLVYFENGVVKDVCRLPFELPEDVQLVHTGRNGVLFVVTFQQGNVCAVWKDTFQASSQWSGVSSVHVDNFLGCGTDQMLLIFQDEGVTGQPLENFILTDLCGISFSQGQQEGAPKASPPPPDNYLLTIRALESRLQSGLTVLQGLQQEVRVKERVLQQSIGVLTDVVSEREPVMTQHEQEGLVALWDCDDDDDDESKDEACDDETRDVPAVSSKPQADKLWHRIAGDRMVVGVILTTDSSVPSASVSLSILTETGQSSTPAVIQTQSQVFWLPAPSPSSSSSSSSASPFSEPAAKRSKQRIAGRPHDLNTCRLAVTAVTRLTPLLNSGCVKCRVMLHYVQRKDAFALVSNPTPVVRCCGEVTLDICGDFTAQLLKNPELKTDEVKEDLLSLFAMLDQWVFHIDSPDHSLGDINGWIHKREGCMRIEVSPQYLLLNSSGPSAVMLLHWHQITPFQGELSVHSSQLQMLQLLDSLLDYLPVSCSIKPVKGPSERGELQTFSLALEKEVVSLQELVTSLLCGEQEDKGSLSPGPEETLQPGSLEGLQRCREVWQRDVERSRRSLRPLLDAGRYRKLIQRLSEVQLDGDLAALVETQRSLLS